ncbi:helix-hairpin-helix domain-containing protein [Arthrobacter sp. 7Tela_A1]|uniref:helix-hairpin-helix domain-containing protein n=1 Tax=Arthrobacter sp. 7Tela_A1 TaxID=3093745 RepID=UPI003BB5DAF2
MAAHRWDTEPPDTLTSRLAARREAASAGTDDVNADPRRRRWGFPFRAAVLAVCLLLAGAVAFPLVLDTPHEAVSIELDVPDSGETAGTGGDGPDGAAGPGVSTVTEEPPGQVMPGSNPSAGNAGTGQAGADLVVHVAGSVVSPGIVRIRSGSRVADAVEAAGGATPEADLRLVNLAATLEDGNMVVVPVLGDPAGAAPGASAAEAGVPGAVAGPGSGMAGGPSDGAGAEGGAVNLNTAGEAELQTLPRVGPVLAARIVAWRTDHGRFTRPEDLDAVPGIGEAMLNALLPLVTV